MLESPREDLGRALWKLNSGQIKCAGPKVKGFKDLTGEFDPGSE
jgi:hypothetical protein